MRTPTSRAIDPPPPLGPRRDRRGGFTLIELVLALAIISLLAALALPAARPGAGSAMLRVKASEVAALLRADRNVAVTTGRPVVTEVDVSGLEVRAGGSARILTLPAGVPIRVAPAGLRGVQFSRDGRSSGARIELGARAGGIAVTVNPLTAAVQVEAY